MTVNGCNVAISKAFDNQLLHGHPSRRTTSTTSSAVDIIGRALEH